MSAEPAPNEPVPIGITDDDVDEAILACGGDLRSTIKALLISGQFLEAQLDEARREASWGYIRGRPSRHSGDA